MLDEHINTPASPLDLLAVERAEGCTVFPPIPCAFVLVVYDHKALWGLRSGTEAAGIWGWPGGKADRPGSMRSNASAELVEETNIWVWPHALHQIDSGDEWTDEATGQSYPCSYYRTDIDAWTASLLMRREPHKHAEWRWFSKEEQPENVFPHERKILEHTFL